MQGPRLVTSPLMKGWLSLPGQTCRSWPRATLLCAAAPAMQPPDATRSA